MEAARKYRIKPNPDRFGGGWNLQLIQAGRIIKTHTEPHNKYPQGFEFDGKKHYDLSFLACKLNGETWVSDGGMPV
ncbi:hypothetical protein [Neisseria zalophi]|uniref:Uncharacterized protein n=1 Tax=Neisseria zalophi TaxID=640030 RepID=A0A5J6PXB7_9NEIS|nr:hypothetical protein [Neisseria zalophi]QEY25497.1 hypothetical protein D0T92_02395 [Neisseria zalophi]QEY26512.1 hypothetical protein D0T92_08200 [Neisseria zalophi]